MKNTTLPLVNQLTDGARFTLTSRYGSNAVIKLGNDEFTGIADRPIAYFTFADARGVSPERFHRMMRGQAGYVPGVMSVWQHDIDTGATVLTPAPVAIAG